MWGHLRAEEDALRETNPAGPLISDSSLQDGEKIDFCCVSRPVCRPAAVAEISPTRPASCTYLYCGEIRFSIQPALAKPCPGKSANGPCL